MEFQVQGQNGRAVAKRALEKLEKGSKPRKTEPSTKTEAQSRILWGKTKKKCSKRLVLLSNTTFRYHTFRRRQGKFTWDTGRKTNKGVSFTQLYSALLCFTLVDYCGYRSQDKQRRRFHSASLCLNSALLCFTLVDYYGYRSQDKGFRLDGALQHVFVPQV
jgi:hypothetical protein